MKSLVNKVFGVKTVQAMNVWSCEKAYCSAEQSSDTMFEYFPSGYRVARGCC